MHPLHDYVAQQLADRLRARKIVVWYDPRREFAAFVAEVRGTPRGGAAAVPVTVAECNARLAEYDGSFFELRAVVEPHVSGDVPEAVLIYVPGCERDREGSVLMELEKAGECYERQLKRLARNVLRTRYTDGVIDEMLAPERVTYEDLARAMSGTDAAEPPSILKAIFHDVAGNEAMLATFLASPSRDGDIEAKEATSELVKLVKARVGLALPAAAGLAKLRAMTLRYVLAGEFRSDLRCPAPASVEEVPAPRSKEEEAAVRGLSQRLRTSFADVYADLADRVEAELGLRNAKIAAESLGAIDTFRFEERALLGHCGELITALKFDEALAVVGEREASFWLDRDVERKAHWEACRLTAELGRLALSVRAAVGKADDDANAWVERYTAKDGWYRMDQAQRRLEAWLAKLPGEPEDRPLAVVRQLYEDACRAMAQGFTRALEKAKWVVSKPLHQTSIFSEVVSEQPKPVAYFLVDAMRFEMGVELSERLPRSVEVAVRPAVVALPSITQVGMAALLPGAAASFSVVAEKGKLGARIDEVFLPDVGARKKLAAARVPQLVDLSLDELLTLPNARLAKKVEGAQVVIVRSQEIDAAGEGGFSFQARAMMDTVIDNLARAMRKLASAGVEHAVVTADHGHLFFASDRDASMRTEAPGGDEVDLHRRCWIGRGGSNPPGTVRASAAALGYASDLEFVFPIGGGVFRSGGDLAFHHGGLSLQEMIVPVLTLRWKVRESARPAPGPITVLGAPEAVTNRFFSLTLQLGGQNLSLFASEMVVRPVLMSGDKQVGYVGMAMDAQVDRDTGSVLLQTGKPLTVVFRLTDDTATSLRVVVQDPATDGVFYRSPSEIPIRLL